MSFDAAPSTRSSTATTSDRSNGTRRSKCHSSQVITRAASGRADTPAGDAPSTRPTDRSSTFAATAVGAGPSRPSSNPTWHSGSHGGDHADRYGDPGRAHDPPRQRSRCRGRDRRHGAARRGAGSGACDVLGDPRVRLRTPARGRRGAHRRRIRTARRRSAGISRCRIRGAVSGLGDAAVRTRLTRGRDDGPSPARHLAAAGRRRPTSRGRGRTGSSARTATRSPRGGGRTRCRSCRHAARP